MKKIPLLFRFLFQQSKQKHRSAGKGTGTGGVPGQRRNNSLQDVKTKPSYLSGVIRRLSALRLVMAPIVSLITLVCTEWIHRGEEFTPEVLTENVLPHLPAFLLTWLLLGCIYQALARATRLHPLAVLVTGALGCIPAAVTYYKLKLRGEPFFPWDLSQVSEASDVMGKAGLELQTSMWVSGVIFCRAVCAGLLYSGA